MRELRVYASVAGLYADPRLATLGANIREQRERKGFRTARAFAQKLGVPESRLSDWENDRYEDIKLSTILRIARHLEIGVDELLAGAFDLPRQAADQRSGSQHEVPHVSASAERDRISALERQVATYRSLLGEMQDVAFDLADIATRSREAGAPPLGKAAGRGRRRGTN